MNKVILTGRLTADPEIKTAANKNVCQFSVAVQRRFAKDGQQQADFLNCVAWDKTAEFIGKYFVKGQMIAIEGRIQTRSWEGKDGKKQYATDIMVENVEFAGEKRSDGSPKSNNTPVIKNEPQTNNFAAPPDDDLDLPF